MSKFLEVTGGIPLVGEVTVGGAKNAVLPMLIASLLTSEECSYSNVPRLQDVSFTVSLLEHFGAEVSYFNGRISSKTSVLSATEASYSLVKAMRASFWVLGPLLARGGAARVAMPGGDVIGARPVDMHLAGLTQMGADIKIKHGVVFALAKNGLVPATINLRFPSVGATHQLMMAAVLTRGTTVINGVAKEPEVVALADFLNSMGADVEGAGTPQIVVRGQEYLTGTHAEIIGDRIEAGTFLLAAAMTHGDIKVCGFNPKHLGTFLDILFEIGLEIEVGEDFVHLSCPKTSLKPVQVKTGPFPELATDFQAPLMAFLTQLDGESQLEETIFEGRFGHISELCRMGAKIIVEDRVAKVYGATKLSAAPIEGTDIRAVASLVLAALGAKGISRVQGAYHLGRGYSDFETKLRRLGAKICIRMLDPDDYAFTGC